MGTKHTQGPLRFERVSERHPRGAVYAPGNVVVASDVTEANARLIVAAPELLAALEKMPCVVCEAMVGQPPRPLGIPGIEDCPGCRGARAAVAKARGES